MYRLFSTVFKLLAGVFGIAVFANQFVVRARPLMASVGWTLFVVGSLFVVSVAFDRLDAKSHRLADILRETSVLKVQASRQYRQTMTEIDGLQG